MYVVEEFPKLPRWRRVGILVLAVATAVTVVLTLLDPPGGVKRTRQPQPPDVARCANGNSTDCVGGMAGVIVLQPLPATIGASGANASPVASPAVAKP